MDKNIYFLPKDFGSKIKSLRLRAGLTQAELAERVDVSVGYIAHLEKGIKYPSLELLIRLVNELDTSFDYVLADKLDNQEQRITALINEAKKLSSKQFNKFVSLCDVLLKNIDSW